MYNEHLQITPENPLIVTSQAQLELVMFNVLGKCGITAMMPEQRKVVQTEMPTKLARKYLLEKGHRVIGDPSFNALIKEYGITAKKRGKENWYQVSDLDKIPNRL